ncbi:ArnT family glycosyltransferase [Frigoribacterium salinisoli]
MTATTERPRTTPAAPPAPRRTPYEPAPDGWAGRPSWIRRRGRDLVWLLPALALAAVAQAWNLAGSPQRIDDEGTYTAQAWAVANLGEIAHYTYWYDHPPVGWLQIAAYTTVTGAFGRHDIAVVAAREAVLVATLVAAVLLWALARRIGLSRLTATAATVVFAVSPLALQYHRTAYLDNVATPWLLAAFLLALSRRYQLAGFVGAAAAFGVAVLSKETYLLALPFLVWVMWRTADRATRRYTLSVSAALLTLLGLSYVALALVKGEVVPGQGRVSLWEGITYQLGSREGSGSVLVAGDLANEAAAQWWALDPVLIVLGTLAAVVGLSVRRLRPFAALVVFLLAFMFRPGGYLPVPYVIVLLPFAALLVAGVGEAAVRAWRGRTPGRAATAARRTAATAWLGLTAVAVVVAVPLWTTQLRGFFLADLDAPMRQAQEWVVDNVPRDSRLLVDDAMWVDLVEAGFDRDDVIWFYKLDTDGAVVAQNPNGWADSDFLVTTESIRTSGPDAPQIAQALENSTVVASFGQADQQVDVRRIDAQGAEAAQQQADEAAIDRSEVGRQLAANPSFEAPEAVRTALADGRVDERAVLSLAQLASLGPVTVDELAALPGEQSQPARSLVLTDVEGRDRAGTRQLLEDLGPAYGPQRLEDVDGGLRATWPVPGTGGPLG